jgi:hypothetical protein
MPNYEIYFCCNECNGEHPTHLRIHLNDGPEHKETLGAFLLNHSMPPQLTTIGGRKAFCLKTGKILKLENNDQIFLVPYTVQLISDEK